ncbi:MAG: S1 RNA-binding domain-containing protein [Oscillospiraceae bacterium]
MQLEVGKIYEGKITGITKFGAFVALPEGKSGLVHISEVANTFVNDVHDYVKEGEAVKVKVIGIADDGKINLSIKKADETIAPPPAQARPFRPAPRPTQYRQPTQQAGAPTGDVSFEDKLKHFMQESDSKIADNKYYTDRRQSKGKRK